MRMEQVEYANARFGTPLYIFDTDVFHGQIRRIREIFGDRAGICYAMKANPFLAGQAALEVDRIEVCSMGEFRICREMDIPPEKLIISGVLKKKEDLEMILDYCGGKSVYTAESWNQFRMLAEWCDAHRESVRVFPRLTSGNQFGVDKKTLDKIFTVQALYPRLKIQGIHYFSGTQKKGAAKMCAELQMLEEYFARLEQEEGIFIEELEYGPGVAASYFLGQEDRMEQDFQDLAGALDIVNPRRKITLEMGRAFAATCGWYLTSVRDIKKTDGRQYCIVDGGMHQINYDGQIRGMYQPQIQVCAETPRDSQEQAGEWTICGALCTGNDVLVQKAQLGPLQLGDVLVFGRAGAYAMTEGMALFLSHDLPKVVFYSEEDGWTMVRNRKPTYEWNMERR